MKKISFWICIVLSIALLTACSNSLASTSPNSEATLIQVVNNSNEKIHLVELHVHQYAGKFQHKVEHKQMVQLLKKETFLVLS